MEHFLPARRVGRPFARAKEGRKEERGRGPRSSSEKIGSRHRRRQLPLFPKRLHRRREPSPALFQHFAALFYLTRVRLSCDWIIQIPFSVLSLVTRSSQPAAPAHSALSVRHVYPEIFTPWRFPTAFSTSLLLSILKPHTSKRPSNSAGAHRSSDKCRACNAATSERCRLEWVRLSENCCSRMHCVNPSINFRRFTLLLHSARISHQD